MDLGDFIHHGGAGQKLSKIFRITGATGFAVPSQAVKSAGSRSNPDGLFCAGITQLRTWLNSPPWLWLPETYCTLHNCYPIGKCLVLGSGCVLVPKRDTRVLQPAERFFCVFFPNSFLSAGRTALTRQEGCKGRQGCLVWVCGTPRWDTKQVQGVLPKMLQRLVDRVTLDEMCGYPEGTAPRGMAERREQM